MQRLAARCIQPAFQIALTGIALLAAIVWNLLRGETGAFYLPVVLGAAFLGWPGAVVTSALAWLSLLGPLLLNGLHLQHSVHIHLKVWLDVVGMLAFGSVVAALGHGSRTVEMLAYCDPLTGLPDDTRIRERLGEEISRASRDLAPLALILFDLDGLAAVNERHGRAFGDDALRETAGAIRRSIRTVDLPGRLYSDEFVVLLPDTPPAGALIVADRIRRAVETRAEQTSLSFTVSAGVVEIATAGNSTTGNALTLRNVEDYLRCAEAALFEARRTGRNRVVSYDPEMYGG